MERSASVVRSAGRRWWWGVAAGALAGAVVAVVLRRRAARPGAVDPEHLSAVVDTGP